MIESNPIVTYTECPNRDGYRVGTDGTAWSCHRRPRKSRVRDGIWWQLSPTTMKDTGRQAITIKGKLIYVHKLVLEAFVGPCPTGLQCCHEDGNPANNALTNLRWDTPVSNQADRDRHGRTNKGGKHHFSTIPDSVVDAIKKDAASATRVYGWRVTLQRKHGVSKSTLTRILNGQQRS